MPSSNVAVLFPGQGAYFPGALTGVFELFPEVKDILEEIDGVAERHLGATVSDLVLETDAANLDDLLAQAPDRLQLCIYAIAVAAYRALRAEGMEPGMLIGHSLGEIAALVAAEAFTVAGGAEIVCHRIAALNTARIDGCMAALGTGAETAQRILALLADPNLVVAVENHAGQTVVSGPRAMVDKVVAIAGVLGISARLLRSPQPFHSPLLASAATDFAERIRSIPQQPLTARVFSPILLREYRDSDNLARELASHLTTPVRFESAVHAAIADGTTVFVEVGAGDALATIAGKTSGAGVRTCAALPIGGSMTTTIDHLTVAGVLPHRSPIEVLRRALAPDLAPEAFDRLWRLRRDRIVELVDRELQFDAEPFEAPVSRTGSPAQISAVPAPAPAAHVTAAPAEHTIAAPAEHITATPGTHTTTAPAEHITAVPATHTTAAPAAHITAAAAMHTAVAPAVPITPAPTVHPAAAPMVPQPAAPNVAAATALSTSGHPPRTELLTALVDFYAEALEYPSEVFEEHTDLEAELGVDSVKQTELLGQVSVHYGLPPRPPEFKIGDHNTLGRIADLIVAA